jgi:hypothetical protein
MRRAERALAVGTAVFLTIWLFVLLNLYAGKQTVGGTFGYVALALMTILPFAHTWGYFGRNRFAAAVAALIHNLFASYVIGLLWSGWIFLDHRTLLLACAGTLFMSLFLILGYLMVVFRVTVGWAGSYAYLGVTALTIAAAMIEVALG